jgi:hypothetical protein
LPGSALECKAIAQVLAAGDDAGHDGALAVVCDQWINEVDLVHGDELQDLGAHLTGRIARERIDHLHALGNG